MTQPWFDPNQYAWIPGTVFGIVAVALGAVAAWLVPKGRAKEYVVRAWVSLLAVAIILFIAGITALSKSQPWGVWYGLLLPGIIGTVVLSGNLLVILKKYREVK